MGIKNLFNSSNKSLTYSDYKTQKQTFESVESIKNAEEIDKKNQTFVPSIDYSNPIQFSRFGSAELYYKGALDKIINYYPYDGSKAEQNAFFNFIAFSLVEQEYLSKAGRKSAPCYMFMLQVKKRKGGNRSPKHQKIKLRQFRITGLPQSEMIYL